MRHSPNYMALEQGIEYHVVAERHPVQGLCEHSRGPRFGLGVEVHVTAGLVGGDVPMPS